MSLHVDQEKIDRLRKEREIKQLDGKVTVVEEQCAFLAYELMMSGNPTRSSIFTSGSFWFDSIKSFYEKELWDKTMVKDAVGCGKIDSQEYKNITGEEYKA